LASKNTKPLASFARVFSSLTCPFYSFGQLFSDLASENTELLASLGSVGKCLEKLIHTPDTASLFLDLNNSFPINTICLEKQPPVLGSH
jgi:hypothetical protein